MCVCVLAYYIAKDLIGLKLRHDREKNVLSSFVQLVLYYIYPREPVHRCCLLAVIIQHITLIIFEA